MIRDLDLPVEPIRAVVSVDGVDTEYLRIGRGAPLLLITDTPNRTCPLARELGRQFRVLAPVIPASVEQPADFVRWLQGFLDGLGVDRASVFVDDRYREPVERMAAGDANRIATIQSLP
jgi:hypothetical protein